MSRSITYLLACAVALCISPAFAGPLAVDTTAIFGFHGSTTYQGLDVNNNPTNLVGTVDYAVWAPGTFPGAFSGFSASDYVYTYQVTEGFGNTGNADLSFLQVFLSGPTDVLNIGDFTGNNGFGLVTGIASDGAFIFPFGSANWPFDAPTVPAGSSTDGLAYSSPNAPVWSSGQTLDDGSIGFVIPLPAPNPVNAPEPGTLMLASCGLVVLVSQWFHRRGRKQNQ
jgi:hypothetical protein